MTGQASRRDFTQPRAETVGVPHTGTSIAPPVLLYEEEGQARG